MKEKTYTIETLKQICGDEKLKEVFETHKSREDGLWVRKLPQRERRFLTRAEQAIFEWHPEGNLDRPALPYPFTARQLAAFSLAGGGSAIREICVTTVSRSPDDGIPDELTALDEEYLAELGDNADDAREALREVHRLYAECVARFGSTDKGVRDAANWLLAYRAEAPNTLPLETSQMATAKSVEDDLSALPTADAGSTHTEVKTDRCLENKDHGPMPLTTGHIAFCFDGLRWTEAQWKKPLGDRPNWLKSCVQSPGKQGVRETLWNPVCIGAALVNRGHVPVNRVRAKFQTNHLLKPWLDAWRTYEFDHLETP